MRQGQRASETEKNRNFIQNGIFVFILKEKEKETYT